MKRKKLRLQLRDIFDNIIVLPTYSTKVVKQVTMGFTISYETYYHLQFFCVGGKGLITNINQIEKQLLNFLIGKEAIHIVFNSIYVSTLNKDLTSNKYYSGYNNFFIYSKEELHHE